jgi:hypothetical protein
VFNDVAGQIVNVNQLAARVDRFITEDGKGPYPDME